MLSEFSLLVCHSCVGYLKKNIEVLLKRLGAQLTLFEKLHIIKKIKIQFHQKLCQHKVNECYFQPHHVVSKQDNDQAMAWFSTCDPCFPERRKNW